MTSVVAGCGAWVGAGACVGWAFVAVGVAVVGLGIGVTSGVATVEDGLGSGVRDSADPVGAVSGLSGVGDGTIVASGDPELAGNAEVAAIDLGTGISVGLGAGVDSWRAIRVSGNVRATGTVSFHK